MYQRLVFTLFLVLIFPLVSMGQTAQPKVDTKLQEKALQMVPGAKVHKVDGNEFELRTPKNTIVEVELNRDGTIDEASGDRVNDGDVFVPGNGLMSLAEAVEALKKSGKTPSGDWSFENSMMHGWIFEFEGTEGGQMMDYAISAKDGKLVKDRRDIL